MVDHLAALDHSSQKIQTMIPMQVLLDIDNAKNPMLLTKDRLERAATENQFMNGKIAAIEVFPTVPDADPLAHTLAVLQVIPQRCPRSKLPRAGAAPNKARYDRGQIRVDSGCTVIRESTLYSPQGRDLAWI